MKHALVICQDFPPCRAPGAAVRTQKFTRYLGEFGWRTTILARAEPMKGTEPECGSVIRLASPTLACSYQLTAWLWAAAARLRARQILGEGSFDLIYVSCPPFPLGLAGVGLAASTGLPLVVDFRDPWSMDPYEPRDPIKRWVKRALCRWVWPICERRIVGVADRFVVVAPSVQHAYGKAFANTPAKPVLLANGFDEEDYAHPLTSACGRRPASSEQRLELLYCGRFTGVAHRSPECLLLALRALDAEGKRMRLRVLGDISEELRALVVKTGTQDIVDLAPAVPHREAVAALAHCDAVVLYQEPSSNEVTAVAGKTYEYLRAGKPVLSVAPPGDNVDLVQRYAGYSIVCLSHSTADLMDGLRCLHADWVSGKLPRCTPPPDDFLERFNRRALTAELARLFDEVSD